MSPLVYVSVDSKEGTVCVAVGLVAFDDRFRVTTGCDRIARKAVLATPQAITCPTCAEVVAQIAAGPQDA